MKEIIFILSSLNDSHFRKRAEEFINHGYFVTVYGFKRKEQALPISKYPVIVLGEINNRDFKSRILLYNKKIKSIASSCEGKLCFYSSLDIALFAKMYIKAPYIYEVCDLTELTIGNPLIRNILIYLNKKCIKNSMQTIFTSEGFYDFFKSIPTDKVFLIQNKISPDIPNASTESRNINTNKIKIGFVGVIRFETTFNFIKVCAERFNNIEIHLYGLYSYGDCFAVNIKELVDIHDNIIFHGPFKNPVDLPSIYGNIDMVLSAYPPTPGVIYAEPNKFYEAIYFRCPIIVNERTFLGSKVKKLNIGYVIDALNENSISSFMANINVSDYNEKVSSCKKIDQQDCLSINDDFFEKLESIC